MKFPFDWNNSVITFEAAKKPEHNIVECVIVSEAVETAFEIIDKQLK